ncbi:cation efflux protein, CzcI family [Ramlibacter alkalitolerans]|uniref:Cobalt-zinc-cadmium resistance protein n=1 Tax=Ramlibacter alkalitolerans TaxID=2039631 RepID=A0ABS1JSA7_9BURK|nr:hypothetical protein [Ramlibacter alkalitolerans]
MRRFVLLLVTLLLPLQFAWGAVTAYCQHEEGPASAHFGHHEHVHNAQTVKKADSGKWAQDNDCGICHAAALAALTGAVPSAAPAFLHAAPIAAMAHPAAAPEQEPPERPQWARLAWPAGRLT